MAAADPRFHVPDENDVLSASESKASKLEQLCAGLWKGMSDLNGAPLIFDVALTATIYGEVHLATELTEDVIGGRTDPRAKHITETIPVSGRVINPKGGWPVFDRLGLSGYYSKEDYQWSHIRSQFDVADETAHKDTDIITVCEWWDYDSHMAWIDGGDTLLDEPNAHQLIPVACAVVEGSKIFENGAFNKYTRQPFLYSLYKSGLWNRQNLYLTALYSQVFALGRFSKLVYSANEPGKQAPDIDASDNGLIVIENDEKIMPLIQQLIDPQLAQAGMFAYEKGEQTTIYKQVLGQPMGSGEAFSTVSLLSQAGRLPIIPIQRMCGFVIKTAINNALMLLKQRGGSFTVGGIKYSSADIPEYPAIECEVEASLPQDDRMNATIATQLTQGDAPLTSKEYVRRNILKIEQGDVEQKRIWKERAAEVKVMRELAIQMQEAQAAFDQMMNPRAQMMQGAPGGMQGTPMAQPGAQQGLPGMPIPESTGAQQGLSGMPMGGPVMPQEGIPPEGMPPEGMMQ